MEQELAQEIVRFGLLFARIGSCLMLVPGIGDAAVSPQLRLGLGLLLSLLLYPALLPQLALPEGEAALLRALASEIGLGLAFGLALRLAFGALELAGSLVALQSGLAAAALFDPQQGGQTSLTGRFLGVAGLTLFLVLDGHHQLLRALAGSYRLWPAAAAPPLSSLGEFLEFLLQLSTALWEVALRIAAPVFFVAVTTNVALGLVARLVPGIQVFFLAIPIQIALALLALVFGSAAGLGVFLRFADSALSSLPS
ncbi:hypothetical protein HRbin40_00636 [bacterium HR40]|nr:hypothetical protein HRbin40_00636 [bacterium HR40]